MTVTAAAAASAAGGHGFRRTGVESEFTVEST